MLNFRCLPRRHAPTWSPDPPTPERRPTVAERQKRQRRDRRLERYQRVVELHQLGYTQRAISTELGIQRKTVRRRLRAGRFPERKSPVGRKRHAPELHGYRQRRYSGTFPLVADLLEKVMTGVEFPECLRLAAYN